MGPSDNNITGLCRCALGLGPEVRKSLSQRHGERPMITRRNFAASLAALVCTVSPSFAQTSYPTRVMTMIVPFAAGGPTDVLARILGQRMSQSLGQQIIVENVTGAGGTLGAARVARAAPDGYTMVMGNLGTHAASVGLYKNLSYDP